MEVRERRERTVRLLEARLEALAWVSERWPAHPRSLELQVGSVAAATRHAIELRLLTPAEACEIWADVGRRHPRAAWCRRGFDLAA